MPPPWRASTTSSAAPGPGCRRAPAAGTAGHEDGGGGDKGAPAGNGRWASRAGPAPGRHHRTARGPALACRPRGRGGGRRRQGGGRSRRPFLRPFLRPFTGRAAVSFTRKGMLAVYWNADNLSAKDANDQSAPTAVFFQYNPAETTRTLKLTLETESAPKGGDALSVSREADEDFAFKLELDATDGLERGDDAPITRDRGVVPQLLLLQSLLHTTGPAPIAKAVKKKGQQVPRGRIPFTMLVLDSERAVPVRITSLTIHASEFDANLNPVHATADVSFKVLLPQDLSKS